MYMLVYEKVFFACCNNYYGDVFDFLIIWVRIHSEQHNYIIFFIIKLLRIVRSKQYDWTNNPCLITQKRERYIEKIVFIIKSSTEERILWIKSAVRWIEFVQT